MWKGLEGWLPLRGRWLRYFLGVVLIAAVLFVPSVPRVGSLSHSRFKFEIKVSLWDVLHGR